MPVDVSVVRSKLHLPHGERFRSRRSARYPVGLSAIPGAGAVSGGGRLLVGGIATPHACTTPGPLAWAGLQA